MLVSTPSAVATPEQPDDLRGWVASDGERGVSSPRTAGTGGQEATQPTAPAKPAAPGAADPTVDTPAQPRAEPLQVIGEDQRYRVTPTVLGRAAKTVRITYEMNGDSYQCSGWVYATNMVATAGHCVTPGGEEGEEWAENVEVTPGQDGILRPFGSCRPVPGGLYASEEWADDFDWGYDYGAIKLDCNIGDIVGTWGIHTQEGSMDGDAVSVQGYPIDKAAGTQWKAHDRITRSEEYSLYHEVDTMPGQSGSPTEGRTGEVCTSQCAVAIHSSFEADIQQNRGTRITDDVYETLLEWRDDDDDDDD